METSKRARWRTASAPTLLSFSRPPSPGAVEAGAELPSVVSFGSLARSRIRVSWKGDAVSTPRGVPTVGEVFSNHTYPARGRVSELQHYLTVSRGVRHDEDI
eukprot:6202330-Pleurochrysis_carterae.AAC.1